MMHVHIKKSKIKQWLSHPECPAFIKQCKNIFDKALGTAEEEKIPAVSAFIATPRDLKYLIPDTKIALLARHAIGELMFSRRSTHVGNSLVLYYPEGRKDLPAVPGSIEYIIARKNLPTIFAVRQQLPAPPGTIDPFKPYAHFHASVFSATLSTDLTLVKWDWIKSHYGRWKMNDALAVILPLIRVSQSIFLSKFLMPDSSDAVLFFNQGG